MSFCCHNWPHCEHATDMEREAIRRAKQEMNDRIYGRRRKRKQDRPVKKKRRKRSTGGQ